MLLIYENAGQLTLLSTAEGVPVESVVDQIPEGAPWAIVAGDLPSAPRDAWIVDWDAGVITVDPIWQASPTAPQPAYSAAWAALITSALYQRALGLAFDNLIVNTAMTTFGIAFQAHRDLPHEVWAGALSAAAGHLATAINATETPLTQDEMDWVEAWNTANNLGLSIVWGA